MKLVVMPFFDDEIVTTKDGVFFDKGSGAFNGYSDVKFSEFIKNERKNCIVPVHFTDSDEFRNLRKKFDDTLPESYKSVAKFDGISGEFIGFGFTKRIV